MANERLRELRTLMKVRNVDAYYVPSSDFHDSEYVEDYFKCRAFLSGFTGSAGTMVITQAFSGMWTDGRYFVQAKRELEGQDTRLMAMGEEGVPTIEEYLTDHMPEGGVLGFDGRVVNAAQGRKFEAMMAKKHATLSVGDLKRKVAESYRSLRHISTFQIASYAISTLCGMALIVMILLQLRIWNTFGFL